MNRKLKIFKTLPAHALCVCLALSCNPAGLPPQNSDASCGIGFTVADSQAGYTGTDGSTPQTKGMPVTSDNIATLYADNACIVAFRGADEYIPQQPLLSPSVENGRWHTAQNYFWPESGSLDFWAWAPADIEAAFSEDRSALSFSYALPAPDTDAMQDATAQHDIVMAHTTAGRVSYDGGVPLVFGHPLASVGFRCGTLRSGTIRTISLCNVAGGGVCVFDGENFDWKVSGSTATFTQHFDDSSGDEGGSQPFFMIPQTLGGDAMLEVVFDDGADITTYSHSLAGGVWKAGTSHIYAISIPEGTSDEIFVEEIFDGYTKTNVSVCNNSSHNVFLRAMIVANWVDDDGCIVAPCDISREGTVRGFNVSSNGGRWTLYSDGYYYYKKALRPGTSTANLFTSYTPGPAPVSGSHLEITIATQAVEYDVNQRLARAAWGHNIPITGAIE